MTIQRRLLIAKVALVVFGLGMLASAALVVASFVVGVATSEGARLSLLGSGLVPAFLVPVLLLSALITRWRQTT
jgi:uncharacterized membrane protein